MNYQDFAQMLNSHIFEEERVNLVRKVALSPERYMGVFRPTKPRAKLLQNLLQSHEIRFGRAMERMIRVVISEAGYENLPLELVDDRGKSLSLDQYFRDAEDRYYLIEQKVRDDHDSSKKRGQIENFKRKFAVLYQRHARRLTAMMYFIDPTLGKNHRFYEEELKRLSDAYGVPVYLGEDLFNFLGRGRLWQQMYGEWLPRWRDSLPDLPEVDLDLSPAQSARALQRLSLQDWWRLVDNEVLWQQGVIHVLFRTGETLRLVQAEFARRWRLADQQVARKLSERLQRYYAER